MLDTLKKLFFPAKQMPQETIKLSELKAWFAEKTVSYYNAFNADAAESYQLIAKELGMLADAVNMLEAAEIKDPEKIESRVKTVVQGNRQHYANQLRFFVETSRIPDRADFQAAAAFCAAMRSNLDQLGKSTAKGYYASQHLFHKEVGAVAKALKQLDALVFDLAHKMEISRIGEIEELSAEIEQMFAKIGQKNTVKEELAGLRQQKKEIVKKRSALMESIMELERSPEYHDFLQLVERKDSVVEAAAKAKDKVVQIFSHLERGLRKFRRITVVEDELIGQYADNPVEALLADKELKILVVLENLRKNIIYGSLEFKEKEAEKLLERTAAITTDMLRSHTKNISSLQRAADELSSLSEQHDSAKDRTAFEEQLKRYTVELEALNNSIRELERKSELGTEGQKRHIVQRIKATINTEAVIC